MAKKFKIKLAEPHEQSGLTAYAVAKSLKLNQNTVRKYVSEDVIAEALYPHVIDLVEFYGLDWRDPNVVEVIEDAPEGQTKTPLAAIA